MPLKFPRRSHPSGRSLTIAQPLLALVDPHACTDIPEARSVHEAVFDALVTRGLDLSIQPGLAESWEVSSDARTWTFSLRRGVKFHNGERLDSAAVEFSLRRMGSPGAGAALGQPAVYAQYLSGIRIELLNEHALRLTTELPNADLLDILVDGYIVAPRAAHDLGERFVSSPVDTGAFQLVDFRPGEQIVARAHRSYFRGAPKVSEVVWKLVPDPKERRAQVTRGEADIASDLRPQDVRDGATVDRLHVVRGRGTVTIAYLLNCSQGPFSDRRLRRAVNLAVNKEEIIRSVLDGAGAPLSSFVGPGHLGFDSNLEPYRHDPKRASDLLAEAGYGHGLSVTISSPTSMPAEAVPLAELVVQQLNTMGIEAKLDITPDRTEYAHKVRRKEIGDMCCFDSSPLSTYRVLREKLSSEIKGAWWQGYRNARLDDLVTRASRTVGEGEREVIYRECFRVIHDDAPWLFLYNHEIILGVSESLRDWRPRLDGCVIPQLM